MKTEQQKRFEAAWLATWPEDTCDIFTIESDGKYTRIVVQHTFEGFQLGESSGLALAAAECEKKANKHAIRYEKHGAGTDTLASDTCGECAEAIRALMTEGVKP